MKRCDLEEFVNPDLLDELEERGLSLVIGPDEERGLSFLEENGSPVPIERYFKSGGGENATLTYDLDDPYDAFDGFAKDSLFLYLHSMDEIRAFLSKDRNRPDCGEAELIRDFLAGHPDASAVRGKFEDWGFSDRDAIDGWLLEMLGKTDSLEGSPFLPDGNLCLAARELDDLRAAASIPQGDPDISGSIGAAARRLSEFVALHRESLGDEMRAIGKVKEGFAKIYGGTEPAAICGIEFNGGQGCGAMAHPDDPDCDEILVLHRKDAAGLENPAAFLKSLADSESASLNGDVWQWSLTDRDGNLIDGCAGIYGDDARLIERDIRRAIGDSSGDRPKAAARP